MINNKYLAIKYTIYMYNITFIFSFIFGISNFDIIPKVNVTLMDN
jgi:hypothetical protein